jgi:chemotaxis response regulator CheB
LLKVVAVGGSGITLEPKTVYVAPQHRPLYLDPGGRRLRVADERAFDGEPWSTTPLLASTAIELRRRAALVVFPGARAEAAEGIAAIDREGGTILLPADASRSTTQHVVSTLLDLAGARVRGPYT